MSLGVAPGLGLAIDTKFFWGIKTDMYLKSIVTLASFGSFARIRAVTVKAVVVVGLWSALSLAAEYPHRWMHSGQTQEARTHCSILVPSPS